jgi:hypothetical protein
MVIIMKCISGISLIIFLTIVLAFSIIGNASAQPSDGDYIVTEFNSGELSSVTPGGTVTLITGGLSAPGLVAIDSSGNYIVTEYNSGELSSVTPGGTVTLIASGLSNPYGVAIDSSGNYIVTEWGSGELSSVTPGGTVTLITGGLTGPAGVAVYPVIPAPVGGVTSPINKLAIIAPYLALVGLIIAVSTVYVIKKRKD